MRDTLEEWRRAQLPNLPIQPESVEIESAEAAVILGLTGGAKSQHQIFDVLGRAASPNHPG